MKTCIRFLTVTVLIFFYANSHAQVMLSSWQRNTTGKTASYWASSGGMSPTFTFTNTTDSADVLTVAYNSSFVYIRSLGMTDSMGKYLNPGNCVAQNYVHKFPRVQTVPSTKVISPKVGQIGLLINGIPIYGLSNANSWNGSANVNMGSGIWNVEVGKSEGFVLDATLGAHPQMQGAYHSHDKPYRLYANTPTSQHSPIVGFAFDGNPVYGPYGYASPMDAGSAVTRMKTGYSLRNITTRTTLPYGVTASQAGPAVSSTYPLGTYCEDYEWLASNGGDLDKYNGRFCVTPEYPSGTYAYFITIDAAGGAAFPYYIGIEYYGAPESTNFPHGPGGNGLSIPTDVTLYTGGTLAVKLVSFEGKKIDNTNKLSWTVENQGGESRYYLQRSSDGEHYTDLALFNSSTGSKMYSYIDAHPLPRNYYRLKIVESNGAVAYSDVVNLSNSTKSTVEVYPTITNGQLNIMNLNPSNATNIIVSDALGKKLISRKVEVGTQNSTLSLSMLSQGIYLVSVSNNGSIATWKVFKN